MVNASLARRAAAAIVLVGLMAPPMAGSCFGVTLTRYPSVWLRTKDSVTIAWQTDAPCTGTVLFGPTPALGDSRSHAGAVADHSVLLDGLDPGSTYYYRVVAGADTLCPPEAVSTAPEGAAPFRFLAFGDIGAATPEQFEVASRIDSLGADLAILTGDIIYEAGEAANFTPQYFDVYRPTIARIPFYPSLGNHDLLTSNGLPYLQAFDLPVNSATGTERYYSFDFANAHFVALEITVENVAPDPTMLEWLDQDLAATTQTWKFVYFHVPTLSNAGGHGGDPVIQAALDPILEARGVDLVFQGHNHFYTRTYPTIGTTPVSQSQEPNYLNPAAPIYVVTGGGGRSLYPLGPAAPFEAFSKSTFHVTSVDVDGNTLSLRAIERDGAVMDSITLAKDAPVDVALLDYVAQSDPDGVRLAWRVPSSSSDVAGFHVYRGRGLSEVNERLTAVPIEGDAGTYAYLDRSAEMGRSYYYALGAVDLRGREQRLGLVQGTRGAPSRFAISGAVPNPSAGGSEIRFTLDRASRTEVSIHDALGREIRRFSAARLESGPHALAWDGKDSRGRDAGAGVYFVRIRSEEREAMAKLVRVR